MNGLHHLTYIPESENAFGYGKCLGLTVLIRRKDNTFNATRLCNDNGKSLDDWLVVE